MSKDQRFQEIRSYLSLGLALREKCLITHLLGLGHWFFHWLEVKSLPYLLWVWDGLGHVLFVPMVEV